MGDHTEAVQVDYDPSVVSYEELLRIFWREHDPESRSFSRQYMNAVFYHNPAQREAALASKSDQQAEHGGKLETQVIPVKSFTMAEDYHQKYMLKNYGRIRDEMQAIYPVHQDFVDSTAVSRLNGYTGGYGTKEQLTNELDSLGLSSRSKELLSQTVRR